MKKVFVVLFLAMIVVSTVCAKGYVGGTATMDFGSVDFDMHNKTLDDDLDFNIKFANFFVSARGGHFFGKSAKHGVVYNLGFGKSMSYKFKLEDYSAEETRSDIDLIADLSIGYGYRMEFSKELEAVFSIGATASSVVKDDDHIAMGGTFIGASGLYHFNEKVALLFGADCKILYTMDISGDDENDDPEKVGGFSFAPYIGCAFCY